MSDVVGARRAATRERLLDASRDLLAREGMQGVSVEHICERAGYTRGAFYSNFSSKDELVLALLEREFSEVADQLDEAVSPGTYEGLEPSAALIAIMDRFLQLRPPDRELYLLHAEFELRALRGDTGGAEFNRLWRRVSLQVGDAVQRLLDSLDLSLTIPMNQVLVIVMGTYDAELRETVLQGREFDADLLRVTLPRLLLSATVPKSPNAEEPSGRIESSGVGQAGVRKPSARSSQPSSSQA